MVECVFLQQRVKCRLVVKAIPQLQQSSEVCRNGDGSGMTYIRKIHTGNETFYSCFKLFLHALFSTFSIGRHSSDEGLYSSLTGASHCFGSGPRGKLPSSAFYLVCVLHLVELRKLSRQ